MTFTPVALDHTNDAVVPAYVLRLIGSILAPAQFRETLPGARAERLLAFGGGDIG